MGACPENTVAELDAWRGFLKRARGVGAAAGAVDGDAGAGAAKTSEGPGRGTDIIGGDESGCGPGAARDHVGGWGQGRANNYHLNIQDTWYITASCTGLNDISGRGESS